MSAVPYIQLNVRWKDAYQHNNNFVNALFKYSSMYFSLFFAQVKMLQIATIITHKYVFFLSVASF